MSSSALRRLLSRAARTSSEEWQWRTATAVRSGWDRFRVTLRGTRWDRTTLAAHLHDTDLVEVRKALHAQRWMDAHHALGRHFTGAPQRFVIAPGLRAPLANAIRRAFPFAADDAAARGEALVAGRHSLLGYADLEFDGWNHDPVHQRRSPSLFWSSVPYLDARCGDHKIIWERNRHQHWLALGRAYWLTGNAAFRSQVIAELSSWLDANPPLIGINWASMLELGFRTISWLWALQFFADGTDHDQDPWIVDLLLGLDRQLEHIEHNLSYYFSPNTHLTGEALALYVTGRALPELRASRRRSAIGRRILVAEIARQIESDGGHRERSTHYHRYTLDFYLLALAVARITDDPIAAVFQSAVTRLADVARVLADDTGHLPHLGDDDGGLLLPIAGRAPDDIRDSLAIAAALGGTAAAASAAEEALWVLSHPAIGRRTQPVEQEPRLAIAPPHSTALPATGYFVSRSAGGDHIVIDGGPLGYLNAGHAHADALSMTVALGGVPFLIDPGTGCYTVDLALRDQLRSTASHNTVEVDGRPQSMMSGPFQWSRAAHTRVHRWRSADGFDYFDGSHDGYAPLEHRRRVLAMHGDMLVVCDLVGGDETHNAAVYWHLHPRWTAKCSGTSIAFGDGARTVTLHVPRGSVECFVGDADARLGWCSLVYGRIEPALTVRISARLSAPFWLVSVFDLNAHDPIENVDLLPVWAEADALAHGIALRVVRSRITETVLMAEPARRVERQPSWYVGELRTDACMACVQSTRDGRLTRAALVDGSFLITSGRTIRFPLPRAAAVIDFDTHSHGGFQPCAASPVS